MKIYCVSLCHESGQITKLGDRGKNAEAINYLPHLLQSSYRTRFVKGHVCYAAPTGMTPWRDVLPEPLPGSVGLGQHTHHSLAAKWDIEKTKGVHQKPYFLTT